MTEETGVTKELPPSEPEQQPLLPPGKTVRADRKVTVFGAILLQLITLSAAVSGAHLLDSRNEQASMIVSADTASIINAKLLDMQGQGLSEDEFRAASAGFMKKLLDRMAEYKEAGYTVVNDQAVITAPESVNITKDLASYLGVNPNALASTERGKLGRQ